MTQRRIAVLIDNIESDYQIEVLSGVLRATRASSINTVIVPGERISEAFGRNFIYDLIPGTGLDGMLVLAGSLSHLCGVSQFQRWLENFRKLPLVCIGLDIPGWPSVHVDNASGARATVVHLIERHGRRKFACFRGPIHSMEAEQRHAAYAKALADHGLVAEAQREWSCPTFAREDGHAGIRALFGERGLSPADVDALVCVNDDVALGALEALAGRGVVIPDQMSVVGFDDAPNARSANPPLTTVNQCVELQGYTAASQLVEFLERGTALGSQRLDSHEVLRASCGCVVPYQNDSRGVEVTTGRATRPLLLSLLGRQATLKAQLSRAAAGRLGNQSGWEEKLLCALSSDLQDAGGAFRYALESVARRFIAAGGSVDPCNDVLSVLRLQVLGAAAGHPEARAQLEDLFQETRLVLTQVALAAYEERARAAANHLRNISRTCLETLATREMAPLSRALSEHLPPLGISACAISRLSSGAGRGQQLEVVARLAPNFNSSKPQTLMLSSLGVDQTLAHLAAVVLMPLDFNRQAVGIAGFAWGAHNPRVYELLREVLCVAVYSTVDR